MFYKLKPQAPGVKITPPNVKNGRCFIQSTPQDSDRCLKVGSLVLYEVCIGYKNSLKICISKPITFEIDMNTCTILL